jgi:hypothetical protein
MPDFTLTPPPIPTVQVRAELEPLRAQLLSLGP